MTIYEIKFAIIKTKWSYTKGGSAPNKQQNKS